MLKNAPGYDTSANAVGRKLYYSQFAIKGDWYSWFAKDHVTDP